MAKKLKFHIGDILSVITGMTSALPEKPPIDQAGNPLPARETLIDGVIQTVGYTTGTSIEQIIRPGTGKRAFNMQQFVDLAPIARVELLAQFPQFAPEKIGKPEWLENDPPEEIDRKIRAWVSKMEAQFGSYFEVQLPQQRYTNRPRGGIRPDLN